MTLQAASGATSARRPDVDVLRVVAISAVFVVHVAQVYTPWQEWHIQNAERSKVLGEIAVLIWAWAIPLFMLLAGSGTFYSLGHRSNRSYLRERTLRILLPLLVGTLLVVPPQVYVERLAQGRFQGNYLQFYPRFFDGLYPEGNFMLGHLWFLGYLFAYSVVTLPLVRWLRDGGGRRVLDALGRVGERRGGLVLLGLLPIASQLVLRQHFPRDLRFIDDWADHAWFLSAYFLGFLIAARTRMADTIERQWRLLAAPAVILSAALAVYAWRAQGVLPETYDADYILFWVAFGLAGWCWLLVLVGACRSQVTRRSPWLDWASRSVYPFYIFHQTVIVVLAYFVVRRGMAVATGFATLGVTSLILTLVLTELVRRLRVSQVLFGFRAIR